MASDANALLLDTNVLVYSAVEELPQHDAARQRLAELASTGRELWISPQVIREFVSVMTRPGYFSAPLERNLVLDAANEYCQRYVMAAETPAVTLRLLRLLRSVKAGGGDVYDVNLAATALEHGIGSILTANVRDFAALAGVIRVEEL